MKKRKHRKLTDEMIAKAVIEYDRALMASLPDPRECKHEFSETFEQKMAELINGRPIKSGETK